MSSDKKSISAREEQHRRFGGEVHAEDFYSAEYYDPSLHLEHFLDDWDYDIELKNKSDESEETE